MTRVRLHADDELEVFSGYEEAVREGRAFTGGAKVSGTNTTVHVALLNPAVSGKLVSIVGWSIATSIAVDVQYLDDPTVTSALRTITRNNQAIAAEPGAEVRSGDSGLSGGTIIATGLSPDSIPVQFQFPFVMPPGQSFAVQAQSGALASISLYVQAFWYETALG